MIGNAPPLTPQVALPRLDTAAAGATRAPQPAAAPDLHDFEALMQAHEASHPRPHRPGALHHALEQLQTDLTAGSVQEPLAPDASSDEVRAHLLRQIERETQSRVVLEVAKTTLKATSTTVEKILNQK
jgi:hypothetical protein